MNTNIVDLRSAFFARSYNNVLNCAQALKPGIFQHYCNDMLIRAQRKASEGKLNKAEDIVKSLNHLLQTFPDNPSSACNLSLLFNAAFNADLPLFVCSEPIIQCFDIHLMQNFLYFYCEALGEFKACRSLHILDNEQHYNSNRINLFNIERLHIINGIFNQYLQQVHLIKHHKFCKQLYSKKIAFQVVNYSSIAFPEVKFLAFLHSITYRLYNEKYADEYPGLLIAQQVMFYSVYEPIKLSIHNDKLYVPLLNNIAVLLYLFDAYIHHWGGCTIYKPSRPCIHLVHQLNNANSEF